MDEFKLYSVSDEYVDWFCSYCDAMPHSIPHHTFPEISMLYISAESHGHNRSDLAVT